MQYSIIAAMMPSAVLLSSEEQERLNQETSRFVIRAVREAPWFVQAAALCLTPVLWLFLFPSMVQARGDASVFQIKCQKIISFLSVWGGPLASLIQLYQYLCALFYYEHPMIIQRYGLELPDLRQARYRELHIRMTAESS
jgi:hypothetical protein